MDRKAFFVWSSSDLQKVVDLLKEGWVLDPELKAIRLDNAVVYHLVKYSEEEAEALEAAGMDRVVSIKSVDIAEADSFLEQGYELKDMYAKTVTLVKREKKTE